MVINAGCCVAGTCRGGLSTVEVEVIKDDLETVVVVTVSWWMFLSIWMEGGAWPPMPMMEEVEDSFLSEMAESEVEVDVEVEVEVNG